MDERVGEPVDSKRMNRILVLEIGNSIMRIATAQGRRLDGVRAFTTRRYGTVDEALLLLENLPEIRSSMPAGTCADKGTRESEGDLAVEGALAEAESAAFDGAIIGSVVPDLTDIWFQAAASLCRRKPFILAPGLKTGLQLRCDDPASLGADRIADMVAAKEAYSCPLIVAHLGTATTVEVLDDSGAYRGGIIAPGLELGADALYGAAAKLSVVRLGTATPLLGLNTADSIRSGIVNGEAARLDGLATRIEDELGASCELILTGRHAALVRPHLLHGSIQDDQLTLHGLLMIYLKNAKPLR